MRHLLNTLYVTTQGSYLAREAEAVVIKQDGEACLRLPIHTLSGVVCFGQVSCSPPLLGLCAERDVAVSFLTEHGKFLARVVGSTHGNVLLRRAQYRIADSEEPRASIARGMVIGKVSNCRVVLLRAARERPPGPEATELEAAARRLAMILSRLESPRPLDEVRGIEGEAAQPPLTCQELAADLEPLIETHRRLWLARNRPGGLEDSVAWLEHLLDCYRSGTTDRAWGGW